MLPKRLVEPHKETIVSDTGANEGLRVADKEMHCQLTQIFPAETLRLLMASQMPFVPTDKPTSAPILVF